jgi:hypothetical protein
MVWDDIRQQAEKYTKGTKGKTRRKDACQILRIDMDDEVLTGMNKGAEEMVWKILSCHYSEMIQIWYDQPRKAVWTQGEDLLTISKK